MGYNGQSNVSMSWQTAEDLSANQFTFVTLDTTAQLKASRPTDFATGILSNAPSVGADSQYAGTVELVGVTRLAVGGVYAIGTVMVPGTDGTINGLGYSVADATSNYKYARAKLLEASTAAYDVVAVQLIDANPGVNSTTA